MKKLWYGCPNCSRVDYQEVEDEVYEELKEKGGIVDFCPSCGEAIILEDIFEVEEG